MPNIIYNKFFWWYINIIAFALERDYLLTYTENHHILPKSMRGTDDLYNIVALTAKEHFVCHHLLTKFTVGITKGKLSYAFMCMCNSQKNKFQHRYIKINAKSYEVIKQTALKYMKISCGNNKGRKNGNFKGYYYTPFGKFESFKSILPVCPHWYFLYPSTKITFDMVRAASFFTKFDIGKKIYECGFFRSKDGITIENKQRVKIMKRDLLINRKWYHTPFGSFLYAIDFGENNRKQISILCKSNINGYRYGYPLKHIV